MIRRDGEGEHGHRRERVEDELSTGPIRERVTRAVNEAVITYDRRITDKVFEWFKLLFPYAFMGLIGLLSSMYMDIQNLKTYEGTHIHESQTVHEGLRNRDDKLDAGIEKVLARLERLESQVSANTAKMDILMQRESSNVSTKPVNK